MYDFPISHDTPKNKDVRSTVEYGAPYCLRCGFPDSVFINKPFHDTWVTKDFGCRPLCEECWDILGGSEARIEYYEPLLSLTDEIKKVTDMEISEVRALLARAVANGT